VTSIKSHGRWIRPAKMKIPMAPPKRLRSFQTKKYEKQGGAVTKTRGKTEVVVRNWENAFARLIMFFGSHVIEGPPEPSLLVLAA